MLEITMKLDQDVLSALRRSPDEFANEMRGARSQPDQLLRQSDFLSFLGEENMLPHVEAALSRARESMRADPPLPRTKVPRIDGAVSRT